MATSSLRRVLSASVSPAISGAKPTSLVSVALSGSAQKTGDGDADAVDVHVPGVWLRDHCRCPSCFDHQTHQRQVDTLGIPLEIAPLDVGVGGDGSMLRVLWPEDPPHVSVYDADWLATASGARPSVDPAKRKDTRVVFGASTYAVADDDGPPGGWDASPAVSRPDADALELPRHSGPDVLAEDEALLSCLEDVRDRGFALVDGIDVSEAATADVTRRIGFIRPTLYSPDMWMTEVRDDGNDTAYTTNPLKAHTDGCYWQDKPGIQVFHCLRHDPDGGGKTLLVDGFKVAEVLAETDPEAFKFFTSTPLPFQFLDAENDYRTLKKVFEVDEDGDVTEFRYNNEDRATTVLSGVGMEEAYAHLHTLLTVLRRPDLELWLQLKPGTVIWINNSRVMHGRSGFSSSANRQLSGCYLNQEEFDSRLRTLTARFR